VTPGRSFTERVRQELSRAEVTEPEAAVEAATLLRLAGRFHRVGGPDGSYTTLEVASPSGAVVRRVFQLLPRVVDVRPQLWVREPGGVRTATTYGLLVDDQVDALSRRLGLVDHDGRPVTGLPATTPAAVVTRGALLTVAALSAPGRPVHAELRVPSRQAGEDLTAVLSGLEVTARHDLDRQRVVVKSGPAVSHLLDAAGAPLAAADFDERRHRRRLRNDATRLANADAANLRRTIEAAQAQLDVVERAVAAVGWAGLVEELRSLALARLVNPTASLAELGELCDPPVGKSAVHRRMQRLAELGDTSA
jgi:DNA-binding protein WhiA